MSAPVKIEAPTVITAHMNADFDALAAMVAAGKLYPESVLIFPGTHEKNLRDFFIHSATYLFNLKNFKDIDPDSVEKLVVVDTRQRSRLQHIDPLLDKEGLSIDLYDHHPDSDDDLDAEVSVVKPWGSCTAILVDIMKRRELTVNADEATILGMGIFEDTGNFTFNSTTEHDFMAAAWLKERGMDLNVVSDLMTRELSVEQISTLGEMVNSATTHNINGVDVVITQTSTEHYVTDYALLVHKLLEMKNLRVLFSLGRMGDRIHLVARSRTPDVDVGHVCSFFGGGGHPYAASATIKERTMAQVRDELFALLYSHVNPQLMVGDLMSKPPVSIEDYRLMADAVTLMTRFGLKGLPVVERGTKKCVGVLERKIADKAVSHGLERMEIGEYMLRDFQAVTPDTDLYSATEIILGQRQRLVPVIQAHKLVGVITRTDLVNTLIDEPARMPEALIPEKKRERNIRALMRNRLPREMQSLLTTAGELAQDMGFQVYAVGGFVRDIMLASPNLDLDLVVEGDGIAFAKRLALELGGRVKPHYKFRTAVVVLPDNQRVDVATARLEYYQEPAALPTVELSSIKMDLYRRDFTINALAVHLNPSEHGILVDFFGAQMDIKERIIRVLHSLSFVEDPTRILRAVRFEQRFDFSIGGQTMRLIKNAIKIKIFDRLSGARIFHELKLIMREQTPLLCLIRMRELKLLKAIHPNFRLDPGKESLLAEMEKVLGWYNLLYLENEVHPWKLFFLGLFHGMEEGQVRKIIERLSFSNREEREFIELRRALFDASAKLVRMRHGTPRMSALFFLLENLEVEGVLFLMARSKKEEMKKRISLYLSRIRHQSIDISGHDLIEMGIEQGPMFTEILNKVQAAKLDGEAPTREEQLKLAAKLAGIDRDDPEHSTCP